MGLILRKAATTMAVGAAAVAARQLTEVTWKRVRGTEPPTAAAVDVDDDTDLRDLLLWSALVAGAVVIARALAKNATESLLSSKE